MVPTAIASWPSGRRHDEPVRLRPQSLEGSKIYPGRLGSQPTSSSRICCSTEPCDAPTDFCGGVPGEEEAERAVAGGDAEL